MAQQVKNVDYTIVGSATANVGTTVSNLDDGEIRVFPASGTMGALTAGDSFFIACGNGTTTTGSRFTSELIDPAKVEITTRRHNAAVAEQQDSIGYNGTAGSIDPLNNNLYLVSLYVQEYLTSNTDGRKIKHFQYKSDASATQAEIAIGLAGSAVYNFSKEAEQYIAFKALCSAAGATEANNITVTNGSKTVLAAGALTAVVGDFIRFGSPAGGATTTDDVYKVVSISGLNYTMDRPLQVVSGSYVTGTADADVITAAQGAAADWGIDLLGQPLSFSIGKEFYKKARWEMSLKDFGNSNSAREADAFAGVGVYEQAAEGEWFCQGFEGESYRMGEPAIHNFVSKAVAGITYDVFSIRWIEDSVVGFTANVSPKQITIYADPARAYVTDAAAAGGIRLQLEAAIAASKLSSTTGAPGSGAVTAGSLV